ncbi:hypothetical protein GUITHDRAFT_116745 [Guillardia theta CCMP2712]|uniref:Uncharacterized protein n=1 Tax=Guillardia theta (strain CCMP2712) TaxID=905079 RepID=L1IMQ0_GUITC|nr:hypothetical protein GUITHDRAFT_116745 [Guillardia theta CCMP2712]EKX37169.1 hypothetical protein GUITHDRAFT_116745 [Guillardia theta CCMP2712]|eukprot:XP_005824149.1 hypothetical protein GUITHDRAFT_116745 [Guillardia theta CCMP2712]
MLLHACETFLDFTKENPDSIITHLKDIFFSAIFANFRAKEVHSWSKEAIMSLKPYFIMAERQQAEIRSLEKKKIELEKELQQFDRKKSFRTLGMQTEDFDSAMKEQHLEKVRQLSSQVARMETERYADKLEVEEKLKIKDRKIAELMNQMSRVETSEDKLTQRCEDLSMTCEDLKNNVKKLKEEKEKLRDLVRDSEAERLALKLSSEHQIKSLQTSLESERRRHSDERTTWLDSFVSERYDLLNAIETTRRQQQPAMRSDGEKGGHQENEIPEADKSQL